MSNFPVKLQPIFIEGLYEEFKKDTSEKTGEDTDRKEEFLLTSYPSLIIMGYTSSRNQAVNMRVQKKILAPSMKHSHKAYFCP